MPGYLPENKQSSSHAIWLVGAIIVVVGLIAMLLLYKPNSDPQGATPSLTPSPSATETAPAEAPASTDEQGDTSGTGDDAAAEQDAMVAELSKLARRVDGDPLALGKVDAPVVIIEYADFNCTYCGQYARETLPTIIEKYVDAGIVRLEWRDFPLFGEPSELTALAGRAAGAQGKFWEFNETFYAKSANLGHDGATKEFVLQIAKEAGIPDLAQFEADLSNAQHLEQVNADQAEGQSIGVQSTPTFLVNGYPLLGAQPLEVFEETIAQAQERANK